MTANIPRLWVPLSERYDRSYAAYRAQRWARDSEPSAALILVRPVRVFAAGDVLFEYASNGTGERWAWLGWSSKRRALIERFYLQYARFTPTEKDHERRREWTRTHPPRPAAEDLPRWFDRPWTAPSLQVDNRSPARFVPRPDLPGESLGKPRSWSDPDVRRLALSALRAAYSARPVSTNSGALTLFAMRHDPETSRWFITPTAIDDYRRVVGRDIDDAQVLLELGPLTLRARFIRTQDDGKQLWRGKSITNRRLRLIVGPPRPPNRPCEALVTVLPEYDGAPSP